MNILIVGGPSNFMNKLLVKCHKEGHRVSVLTGDRYTGKHDYSKYFELYKFPYEAQCVNEIIDSVRPDVTLFMGAFDSNFDWKNAESTSVHYQTALANVMLNYAMLSKGRFIYLSSHEVFGEYDETGLISEDTVTCPHGVKGVALSNAESYCENYRKNMNKDITVLRLDHLYGVPSKSSDVYGVPEKMCLDCLENKSISYSPNTTLSLLYENDAVEAIHSVIEGDIQEAPIINISSSTLITEEELAEIVRDDMDSEAVLEPDYESGSASIVLSNSLYESIYGKINFKSHREIIKKIADEMKKKPYVFLSGEAVDVPITKKIKDGVGWFFKIIFPFLENLVVFIIAFMLYNRAVGSKYFDRLDIYLLYVLLFAIVYGQQQATVSAFLSVIGYFFRQTYERSGFELLLDANTYVWVAELFIVGLSVGYLKDQILRKKYDLEEDNKSLRVQLKDISDINATNVRIKDVLETQIVNQSDSVGKIYAITSSLDQYSPEEVLFYAAETVGKLIKSKDVAIYTVSNADYARLFSYTSKKAKSLGNSIRYRELEDIYKEIAANKVYINRSMDTRYPLMAKGIFENEKLKLLVFVWGLSWENMNLSQANQLVVVSSLIHDAVLRADRYMAALESERYIEGTRMLDTEAFKGIVKAFFKAEEKGLTECTLLKATSSDLSKDELASAIEKGLRQSDYYGELSDSELYMLLSNTNHEDANFVIERFAQKNIFTNIIEDISL